MLSIHRQRKSFYELVYYITLLPVCIWMWKTNLLKMDTKIKWKIWTVNLFWMENNIAEIVKVLIYFMNVVEKQSNQFTEISDTVLVWIWMCKYETESCSIFAFLRFTMYQWLLVLFSNSQPMYFNNFINTKLFHVRMKVWIVQFDSWSFQNVEQEKQTIDWTYA